MDAPEVRTIDDLTIDELREWIVGGLMYERPMTDHEYARALDGDGWNDLLDELLAAYADKVQS